MHLEHGLVADNLLAHVALMRSHARNWRFLLLAHRRGFGRTGDRIYHEHCHGLRTQSSFSERPLGDVNVTGSKIYSTLVLSISVPRIDGALVSGFQLASRYLR